MDPLPTSQLGVMTMDSIQTQALCFRTSQTLTLCWIA